jgi:threonine synthase
VVVISTANALKFTEFKVNYHTENIKGIQHRYTGNLTELPADYDKIVKHIETK